MRITGLKNPNFYIPASEKNEQVSSPQNPETSKDTVELSASGTEKLNTGYTKDMKISKINIIKNRIKEGYYFTSSFDDKLADSLMNNRKFLDSIL